MDEYRARHHAVYLKEQALRDRIEAVRDAPTLDEVHLAVAGILSELRAGPPDRGRLTEIGLLLVDAISKNPKASTDFSNTFQVRKSQGVFRAVQKILAICGVAEAIEVQYEMDCSRDELIAQQLQSIV
jgi:hypothetical protein